MRDSSPNASTSDPLDTEEGALHLAGEAVEIGFEDRRAQDERDHAAVDVAVADPEMREDVTHGFIDAAVDAEGPDAAISSMTASSRSAGQRTKALFGKKT